MFSCPSADAIHKTDPARKCHTAWVVSDSHEVIEAECFDSPPNEDIWWVPAIGYSVFKNHLHPTKAAAEAAAKASLDEEIDTLTAALAKLEG